MATDAKRGFTLLEVLVAVALLALVVSVLASSTIQGMGYEGDAAQRLRASLRADQTLFEVESALARGAPPQPAHQEQEDDLFTVTLDVRPFDLAGAGLDALLAAPTAGAPAPRSPAAAPALPLFQIFVRVAWLDGTQEREVTRTSFAFDAAAAAEALGASEADAGGGGAPGGAPRAAESAE